MPCGRLFFTSKSTSEGQTLAKEFQLSGHFS